MAVFFTIILVGYFSASILLYFFQDKLIFQGTLLDHDHEFQFNLPFTETIHDRPDGGFIHSLFFKQKESKGLILYYHGNAGNLDGWGLVAQNLSKLGYDVAIMDYREYGKSRGSRSMKTMLSDSLAFYKHYKKDYPEEKIVLFGRSLGTGLAAYVASRNNPSKIILETPYYSFTSLVRSYFPLIFSGLLRYRFNTHKYLKNTRIPVYIFHGTKDSVIPLKQGEKLYQSLDRERVKIFIVESGSHNDLDQFEEYWVNLENIL